MHLLLKCTAIAYLATVASSANAQQSSPISSQAGSSSQASSLAPLSSGIPQLDKYTAAPKSSKLSFSHSTVRLIAGKYSNGKWTAGVEIVLAPGWKTYWRVPGDAGVPAEFVWENSNNVKAADVSWPAPKRYEDITGKSIGYKKHVVFPVEITPENNGQPAKLDLRLYYAICSDICIPAQANLGLDLPVKLQNAESANLISRFSAKVPNRLAKGVAVTAAATKSVGGKPILAVTLAGQVDPKTDILVEGFDTAFFDAPKISTSANGQHVFHLPIDGIDKLSELSGKTLKLTILSGDIRLETNVEVN